MGEIRVTPHWCYSQELCLQDIAPLSNTHLHKCIPSFALPTQGPADATGNGVVRKEARPRGGDGGFVFGQGIQVSLFQCSSAQSQVLRKAGVNLQKS